MINVINTNHQRIISRRETISLITCVLKREDTEESELNLIFVDDNYIKKLNTTYLKHRWVTDVISFPLNQGTPVEGEIYICTNQAKRQAKESQTSYKEEVRRLIIHGVLHLIGHTDRSKKSREIMRNLEDKYLKICKNEL
ncbi:MAG: rRNA maturation RNase YbeY [Bacteroidetes bacterium]|nr:rRNA maturation RNase YbeY [Bacteroidota bacterium]